MLTTDSRYTRMLDELQASDYPDRAALMAFSWLVGPDTDQILAACEFFAGLPRCKHCQFGETPQDDHELVLALSFNNRFVDGALVVHAANVRVDVTKSKSADLRRLFVCGHMPQDDRRLVPCFGDDCLICSLDATPPF